MTITRLITSLCILSCCVACAAPEPVSPIDQLAGENAYYFQKAQTYFASGCNAKALAYFEEAHERYTAADDGIGIAHSLNGIANVYFRTGDHRSALLLYEETIAAYDRIGDTRGMIRALCNKAAALMASGFLREATAVLDQADARSGDNRELVALRTKTRAMLLIRQGDDADAHNLLTSALSLTQNTDPGTSADILYTLGSLVMANRPDQACAYFNQALEIDRSAQAYAQTAKDLKALGLCSAAQGLDRQALAYFKRSAKIFALTRDSDQIAQIVPLLEQSAQKTGADTQAVMQYIQQWLKGETESKLCQ